MSEDVGFDPDLPVKMSFNGGYKSYFMPARTALALMQKFAEHIGEMHEMGTKYQGGNKPSIDYLQPASLDTITIVAYPAAKFLALKQLGEDFENGN